MGLTNVVPNKLVLNSLLKLTSCEIPLKVDGTTKVFDEQVQALSSFVYSRNRVADAAFYTSAKAFMTAEATHFKLRHIFLFLSLFLLAFFLSLPCLEQA